MSKTILQNVPELYSPPDERARRAHSSALISTTPPTRRSYAADGLPQPACDKPNRPSRCQHGGAGWARARIALCARARAARSAGLEFRPPPRCAHPLRRDPSCPDKAGCADARARSLACVSVSEAQWTALMRRCTSRVRVRSRRSGVMPACFCFFFGSGSLFNGHADPGTHMPGYKTPYPDAHPASRRPRPARGTPARRSARPGVSQKMPHSRSHPPPCLVIDAQLS